MPVLPIVMILFGAAAGAVIAEYVAPPAVEDAEAAEMAADPDTPADEAAKAEAEDEEMPAEREVVPLTRRIIVPVVTAQRTEALVLIDVAVEVPAVLASEAHSAMPKLRAAFLTAMLSLSAGGAFDQGVANPRLLEQVRSILTDRARAVLPGGNAEVLVLETLMRRV